MVEIWRTKPYVQAKTNVVVNCGLCGDKSFMKQISGGFHVGAPEKGLVMMTDMVPGDTTTDEKDNIILSLLITTEKVE